MMSRDEQTAFDLGGNVPDVSPDAEQAFRSPDDVDDQVIVVPNIFEAPTVFSLIPNIFVEPRPAK
jgi:hypothetical protein